MNADRAMIDCCPIDAFEASKFRDQFAFDGAILKCPRVYKVLRFNYPCQSLLTVDVYYLACLVLCVLIYFAS